ncbi:MAG TPA: TIGR03086 family metal-binding protein [Dermatophilaceae bacterium]|nr:TIGR03086 family metal-binding protein [Dermatophilaceae bacterium]
MSARDLLPVAAARFGEVVYAVPADRWGAPTPCTQWSVRDVLNHVVAEHLWVPYLLGGGTVAEAGDRFDGDMLGSDPVRAWDEAIGESLSAWQDVTDETPVALSRGETPAGDYAAEMLLDLTVHAWDLARGAGVDDRLERRSVAASLGFAEAHAPEWAHSGMFAEPVDADTDDPQDRLLALLGRDPR